MQVLCCGTRRWNDPHLIRVWLKQLGALGQPVTILVGSDPDNVPKGIIGADFYITEIGEELDYNVLPFPALWRTFGRAAGPIRNKQMIERHPDLVLAFRLDGESFGTDGVVQMAIDREIPVIMIHPDGHHENLRKPVDFHQITMFEKDPEPQAEPAWMGDLRRGAV